MRIERLWNFRSLRARLLSSYLVILGIGGLVTSLIGSWIVSSAITSQMQRTLSHNLETVNTIYDQRLRGLDLVVHLTAFGPVIEHYLSARDTTALLDYLDDIRRDNGLDFLTLTDRDGRVIARPTQPGQTGDDVALLGPVATALGGRHIAATEVLTSGQVTREDPVLGQRARLQAESRGDSSASADSTAVLVMMAAAPVRSARTPVAGALYGGVLLNRNNEIVDDAWDILFSGEQFHGQVIGAVSVFLGNVCVATTLQTPEGVRTVGTLSPQPRDGAERRGPAPQPYHLGTDSEGYVGSYGPLRDHTGHVVGAVHVAVLERVYTSMRDRVILWFFALATAGFLLIIIVTDYMVRQITRPIGEIVAATRNLAAGRFDQEVRVDRQGETALLAESFNQMLRSLRLMKADLEQWGNTLEDKVQQRTEQLVAMQNRVAQSEKLASLGMLAAGVAHEINNPLGGILSLTALALEDLPSEDPARPNLEEVVRQSERCREIVKGLLEFSRQQEAGSDMIDVREVLDDTLALMGKQALFFNIELKKRYDAEVPHVLADPSQLQQVFINIIMNAVQAMGERGRLTVDVHGMDDGTVEVRVADTGCGIPLADIDRVFDPFYTTKPEGQGTGLGLSIAYGIVTKHGGTISIGSERGEGTVVTIRFPASLRVVQEEKR